MLCVLMLALGGCSSKEDQAVETAADDASTDVEDDFKELDEETTDSIKEDDKNNEETLTDPDTLTSIEEDMASTD